MAGAHADPGSLRSTSLHTEAAGAAYPEAFGPFRVLHQIGAGALGPVFRAYNPEQDTLVAVKLFTLDLAPERVHKLVAHLQALVDADLTHPAIAAPVAADITGVSAYLAQDFVAADSVDIVARAHGPAPPAEAVRVAAQVAAALDYAADAGIVHGALHPRDVLVSPDETRLTGVGITRALERVGFATPVRRPYTAPERTAGQPWDRRADVFSLAAIIHELLWGRRITALGEDAAASLEDIAGADPERLRRLFAKALAQDPSARFDTSTAFVEGLTIALAVATLEPDVASRPSQDARQLEIVVEDEWRLPLDEPEIAIDRGIPADVDRDFDIAEVSVAEPAPDEPPRAPAVIEVIARTPAVQAPIFEAVESASRSAVWPLALALGVGLAVGFALGYASSGRMPPELAVEARADAAVAAPAAGVPERLVPGVAETEVRLPRATPEATVPAAATPVPMAAARSTTAAAAPTRPTPVAAPVEGRAPDVARGRPAPVEGRLLIRSTPAGATAFVDGREAGKTPVTLRDVGRGAHIVRVARDGYMPEQRRVTITAARPSQSLTFALDPARVARPVPPPPAPATTTPVGRGVSAVTVESRPPGASVFIDGRLAGRTPLKLNEVAAGDHALAIEMAGYRRWSASVRVVSGEPARVTASLERP